MRANVQTKVRPPVRVRHLPPTLEEAIFAAEGLTDDTEHQAAIAAELMGVCVDHAVELIRKSTAASRRQGRPAEVTFSVDRSGAHRAVVVERKPNFAGMRKSSPVNVEAGGATVERMPFRGLGGGAPRTLLRLGGAAR